MWTTAGRSAPVHIVDYDRRHAVVLVVNAAGIICIRGIRYVLLESG